MDREVEVNQNAEMTEVNINIHASHLERTSAVKPGAPNDNFRKNICAEDDLRSRIFGAFVVKFLACLPVLGFSNI